MDPGWWRTPGLTTAAFAEESDTQWLQALDCDVRSLLQKSHGGRDGRVTGLFSGGVLLSVYDCLGHQLQYTGGVLAYVHADDQLERVGCLLLDFQLTGSNLLDEAATAAAGMSNPHPIFLYVTPGHCAFGTSWMQGCNSCVQISTIDRSRTLWLPFEHFPLFVARCHDCCRSGGCHTGPAGIRRYAHE